MIFFFMSRASPHLSKALFPCKVIHLREVAKRQGVKAIIRVAFHTGRDGRRPALTNPGIKNIFELPSGKAQDFMFGNIGLPELLIIMAIALLIFGPKKLPEVGKSIGKALREFRKASDEIKDKIDQEIHAEEFREIKEELKKDINQDEEGKKIS
jgi:TatA/E family protein of Tat protein translocase